MALAASLADASERLAVMQQQIDDEKAADCERDALLMKLTARSMETTVELLMKDNALHSEFCTWLELYPNYVQSVMKRSFSRDERRMAGRVSHDHIDEDTREWMNHVRGVTHSLIDHDLHSTSYLAVIVYGLAEAVSANFQHESETSRRQLSHDKS